MCCGARRSRLADALAGDALLPRGNGECMAEDAWLPECAICFTVFGPDPGAVPRVLVSCGHTLCESCISRLALRWPLAPPQGHASPDSSAGPGTGGSVTVRCSECGVTSLSSAPHSGSCGALGFPRNIELLRVIDTLAHRAGASAAPTAGPGTGRSVENVGGGVGQPGSRPNDVCSGAVQEPRGGSGGRVEQEQRPPELRVHSQGLEQAARVPSPRSGNSELERPVSQGQLVTSETRSLADPARGEIREGVGEGPAQKGKVGGLWGPAEGSTERATGERVAIAGSDGGPWVCHRDVISAALVIGLGEGGEGER